jgi:FAD/FMN-containing dehydrogenase
MAEWANWSGRHTDTPQTIHAPTSESGIVNAVATAAEAELAVRAVGASHSHSRIAATNGLLVTLDSWQGVESVDAVNQTATIRSGSRIYQLGEPLRKHGLALQNQGDIDRQSIGGATSTGTHGTGPTLQNLSASVLSARIVLASGDVIDCSAAATPELFEIVRHSLGAVGLLTTVTVALRPAYRLHETLWKQDPDSVFDRLDQLTSNTRHFEFFWMPQTDACACKSLAETQDPVSAMPDIKLERIGWSHDIISSTRDDLHTEMEYAVAAEEGPACFNEVREMILRDFPDLQWPLEYRTLAADDLWISAATGRPTVTISAHQDISLDDRPLFEACEAIFRRYGGRPHWGKQHYQTGAELDQLYPKYRDWWRVRDQHDPSNLFVTDYLARLRP